ncbi:hypothetical protein F5Y19DRAFT_487478 [Xylariaceae sp. FL1651]|nr:hypothetical protein F5Y19DRAFT_487478 [Xylariaceae sp. FL1651]
MHTASENNGPTLRGLLGQYPIQTRILRDLDTKSILNLCQTSWDMRTDIRAYLWNIDEKLERFFKDPKAFRSALGRADALISGSFALQFFAHEFWPESDLDINLRDGGENAGSLAKHLMEVEGYELASNQDIESSPYGTLGADGFSYRLGDISRIQTFIKGNESNSKNKTGNSSSVAAQQKVQLITTKNQPVQAILNGYYTSCIVNFISWNKAYCVFPRATLLFRETVPLTPPHDNNVELHKKYSRRGWRLRTEALYLYRPRVIPMMSTSTSAQPQQQKKTKPKYRGRFWPLGFDAFNERRVGGADTWTMSLSTAGVSRPPQPDSVLEYSCFRMDGFGPEQSVFAGNGRYNGIKICARVFESPSLRYEYTIGYLSPFWEWFGDMLARNTLGQLQVKMEEEERLQLTRDFSVHLFSLRFDKPDGWDYWDDVLPDMFEQWREQMADTAGGAGASSSPV